MFSTCILMEKLAYMLAYMSSARRSLFTLNGGSKQHRVEKQRYAMDALHHARYGTKYGQRPTAHVPFLIQTLRSARNRLLSKLS